MDDDIPGIVLAVKMALTRQEPLCCLLDSLRWTLKIDGDILLQQVSAARNEN